ncbi:MAG: sigma-70 family RNA polymerase sigma factor [Fuerstiella sp.]
MNGIPDTQASLLIRVKDPLDRDAWLDFYELYRPVIYRMARRRGLQDADAQDLTQRVLTSVAAKVGDWQYDPERGRFRTWLSTVTRNAIIDHLRKVKPDVARGGSSLIQQLNRLPASDEATHDEIQREQKRQLFRRVAEEIRPEFGETTWMAFWLTSVELAAVTDVADRLKRSIGSIYAVRSRVMRRLRERVSELEADFDEC